MPLAGHVNQYKAKQDPHSDVKKVPCPSCGKPLNITKRTIVVTCQCGKSFKIQDSQEAVA